MVQAPPCTIALVSQHCSSLQNLGPPMPVPLGQHFVILQRPARLRRRCLAKANAVFPNACERPVASCQSCGSWPCRLARQSEPSALPRTTCATSSKARRCPGIYIVLLECLLQLPLDIRLVILNISGPDIRSSPPLGHRKFPVKMFR